MKIPADSRKVLHSEATLPIPESVPKCPYCDTAIEVTFDGFERQSYGDWHPLHLEMQCATEPSIDDDEWGDWFETHCEMPYVYVLPVETVVLEWIKKNFRFDIEAEEVSQSLRRSEA